MLLWPDRKYLEDDARFHQVLVHMLAHQVYHDVGEYVDWLHDSHGWLYEGLAFHDEIELFGPPITTCHPKDQLDLKHWLTEYWESNVLKAVKTRRDPEPSRVFGPAVGDLKPKERQFAWSFVDFLLWYDRAKMADLLVKTKGQERMSSVDVLSEVYGMTPESLVEEWRKFVRKHYKSKPRKGPTERRKDRA